MKVQVTGHPHGLGGQRGLGLHTGIGVARPETVTLTAFPAASTVAIAITIPVLAPVITLLRTLALTLAVSDGLTLRTGLALAATLTLASTVTLRTGLALFPCAGLTTLNCATVLAAAAVADDVSCR